MSVSTIIRLSKDIASMPKNYRKATISALKIIGDLTENTIKKTDTFTDRTGGLRISIKRADVNVRELYVEVFAHKEYGLYLNDGTKDKGGKTLIIAKRFMEKGKEEAGKKYEQIFINELKKKL